MDDESWLLLLYGLPTRRGAERVSLWRKLKKYGAVQLKSSAYVLPDTPTHYERFQWLSKELRDAGGEAALIRVAQIDGMTNAQMVQMFNEARAAEYGELANACREILNRHKRGSESELAIELAKYQRRLREIHETDYFHSPAVHDAQVLLDRLVRLLSPRAGESTEQKVNASKFIGRLWLTRPQPGIDRAGSAWLIRKFIDPKARFVFGMEPAKHPKAVPFDMANADFSHHGDDCTFETLVRRFGISDAAVLKMAEMVHDADLEDGKFQRHECLGINRVLAGWAKAGVEDAKLLTRGIDCFEGLYLQLKE